MVMGAQKRRTEKSIRPAILAKGCGGDDADNICDGATFARHGRRKVWLAHPAALDSTLS
jgi:hypothetical protein